MTRRIGLVYPFTNLDTVPSLCNAISLLADAGYTVDVFTGLSPDYLPATFASPRVETIRLPTSLCPAQSLPAAHALGGGLRRWERAHAVARGAYLAARHLYAYARPLPLAYEVHRRHRLTPYTCLIGVDPEGLVLAERLNAATRVPLAYFSLEILPSNEDGSYRVRGLKQREITLSRRAPFVIVQDTERGKLLADGNGLDTERLVLVPNTPLGPARRAPSRYWHERFSLPDDARVVLHAGSLDPFTGIEGIVASVSEWPEPWHLVVHSRVRAEGSAIVETLRRLAAPGRVHFSLVPLPRDEYEQIVDAADVGIAFLLPDPKAGLWENVREIGLSSGKTAYYLRAGLPVVVNTWSTLGERVTQADVGVAVEDGAGIPAALARVNEAYERLSANALAFFDRELDFASTFGAVLERLGTYV